MIKVVYLQPPTGSPSKTLYSYTCLAPRPPPDGPLATSVRRISRDPVVRKTCGRRHDESDLLRRKRDRRGNDKVRENFKEKSPLR